MSLITDPGCAGEITGGMIVAGLVHAGVMRQGTRAVTLVLAVQQMIAAYLRRCSGHGVSRAHGNITAIVRVA